MLFFVNLYILIFSITCTHRPWWYHTSLPLRVCQLCSSARLRIKSHYMVRGLRVILYWKITICTWVPATGEYSPLQQSTWKGCQDTPSKKNGTITFVKKCCHHFCLYLAQNKSINYRNWYVIGIYTVSASIYITYIFNSDNHKP